RSEDEQERTRGLPKHVFRENSHTSAVPLRPPGRSTPAIAGPRDDASGSHSTVAEFRLFTVTRPGDLWQKSFLWHRQLGRGRALDARAAATARLPRLRERLSCAA